MGALAVLSSVLALAGVPCSMPGEWPHSRDAVWLWHALARAGYHDPDCTGSALAVDYGGPGLQGHDLYIWAFATPRRAPSLRLLRTVGGVPLYSDDPSLRLMWRARRRNVWLAVGPTSYRLPPARILARIVRATVRSPKG